MLNFSKIGVNALRVWNNAAKAAAPMLSPIVHARTMETFSESWERDLGKALKTAKQIQKPVMLVIYRPWCTYCQKLSRDMAKSTALKKMENFFIMAQINEDDTYLDNRFAPDGGVRYVPRVLFLTPEGEIMKGVKNHKSYRDGTLYVYSDVDDIMSSMSEVARKYVVSDSRSGSEDGDPTPKDHRSAVSKVRIKRSIGTESKKPRSHTKKMTTAYIKKR